MLNKMQLQTLRTLVEQTSHERLHALVQSDKVPAQDAEYLFYQELLGELKTQAKLDNGWIGVDDMLPKEFETVLLFGKKYNGQPLITNGHLIQSLVDEFGINDGFSVKMLVTHWQPIPQPPKE